MTFQVFEISELANRCEISRMDGEPFRIRLHFDVDVNRAKKEKAISILRKIGYKQIDNTSSWVLNPKPLETN